MNKTYYLLVPALIWFAVLATQSLIEKPSQKIQSAEEKQPSIEPEVKYSDWLSQPTQFSLQKQNQQQMADVNQTANISSKDQIAAGTRKAFFQSPELADEYNSMLSTLSPDRAQEQLRDSGYDTLENLENAVRLISNSSLSEESFRSRVLAATHLALSSLPEAEVKRQEMLSKVSQRIANSVSKSERSLLALDVRSLGDQMPFREIENYADLYHETDSKELQAAIAMAVRYRAEREILDSSERERFYERLGLAQNHNDNLSIVGNTGEKL